MTMLGQLDYAAWNAGTYENEMHQYVVCVGLALLGTDC